MVQTVLIEAKENTLVSIANFCKQMINSWVWILISLECDVQWSTAYAESNSILSRKFAVYNCRSTYPFRGLSHFLKWTLLLEVFYFSIKIAVNTQRGNSLRAFFVEWHYYLCTGVVRRQTFLYCHQRLEGSRPVRTVFKGSGVGTIHQQLKGLDGPATEICSRSPLDINEAQWPWAFHSPSGQWGLLGLFQPFLTE